MAEKNILLQFVMGRNNILTGLIDPSAVFRIRFVTTARERNNHLLSSESSESG